MTVDLQAQNMQALQMQSLISASQHGGGEGGNGCILGILPHTVQIASFSIGNYGPLKGTIPALFVSGTGRGVAGGMMDKFFAAIQSAGDGFLKSLASTGIQPPAIGGGGDFLGAPSQMAANISHGQGHGGGGFEMC